MKRSTEQELNPSPAAGPFLQRLSRLFRRMDDAYQAAVGQTGFVCRGCATNCCRSLFFHHTYAEWFYLRAGLEGLPRQRQQALAAAARDYLVRKQPGDGLFCPLGEADRCTLCDHRPMICRLHGIPHVVVRPDGHRIEGPGCDEFYRQAGQTSDLPLDRSPLYAAMAAVEKELRQTIGLGARIKLTVAEMIASPLPLDAAKALVDVCNGSHGNGPS